MRRHIIQSVAGYKVDAELRFLLKMSRHFPAFRGFGRLGGLVARFYGRRNRPEFIAEVMGNRMVLDPSECVDSALLFCPHLYERLEVQWIRELLPPGGCFVDAGAHIGFYSLIAAGIVGDRGFVLAIEADPGNFGRLSTNARLNNFGDTLILRNVGLSDRSETLVLNLNLTGNRGGHSFVAPGDQGMMVKCEPLLRVLQEAGVKRVDMAKFDIEGSEHKVLREFLRSAPSSLVPKAMIIEQNERHLALGAGDALALLRSYDFRVSHIKDQDYLAVRA